MCRWVLSLMITCSVEGHPALGERESWNSGALVEGVRVGSGRADILAALEDRVEDGACRSGHRFFNFTTRTNWVVTSTRFWLRQGSGSSRKSRWIPRRTARTCQRSAGELLSQRLEARKRIGVDASFVQQDGLGRLFVSLTKGPYCGAALHAWIER